ncbi:hypothetical protein Vadar_010500 [Vaccinium darrowii]|uniref:Uncharacterized protein n=1 Tax=Vaccinium darrowii TaxID=229202 RepID=A0ACB7YVD6_9ERIC|nr:hypothetical protein Vadar_010500 [Vaccinium darrowii]
MLRCSDVGGGVTVSLSKNPFPSPLRKVIPIVEQVAKLLEYLFAKKVLSVTDIGNGCLRYGSMLGDIYLPKAPKSFGEIMGRLIVVSGLDFKVVKEVLKKMEDDMLQKAVFAGAMRIVTSDPSEDKGPSCVQLVDYVEAVSDLQKAKAEAAIRKLEMKFEKKSSSSMDSIVSKTEICSKEGPENADSVFSNQSQQVSKASSHEDWTILRPKIRRCDDASISL